MEFMADLEEKGRLRYRFVVFLFGRTPTLMKGLAIASMSVLRGKKA